MTPLGHPSDAPHSRARLVVVGNGMAAMRTVEEMLATAPQRYDITVFGAEPHGNYNRILLSSVLAGEKRIADITLHAPEWYAANGIDLRAGDPVVSIDRAHRVVRSQGGAEVGYDRLLIATGSNPVVLPVPGHTLDGVVAFRAISDVERMIAAAREACRAVVIGGGLLGLEAANGLLQQGMKVSVVHHIDMLMERQLDKSASTLLQQALEAKGIRFVMSARTAQIVGDDRVSAVRFEDGREVAADLVVMTAGVRPNIELARQAGLHCERGIVVDDALQTSDPHIYAVGECVQHRGATFGLVAPIWDQARVCGAQLAGVDVAPYEQKSTATRLKVTGVNLFSAGDFKGGPGTEDMVLRDPRRAVYKRLVLERDRMIGAVLFGDVDDGAWYADLIRNQTDISRLRGYLLFGQTLCESKAA
ncbi:NAD(P)/FAD-dependent oxidoreductase [Pararobbsia silviterrae]|uniref:NAD(P)/FAD-dependent oxidoreductase n=1 Tax=Pararobbsia silviterrae TaxID=1792498 RepID=A0A494XTX9_9BURK|nr:FAD-dependent oxidoreductase [Pararobbsia silviterrae]RKP53282.1 NAD(P)/FAD-dependent oxidoreductase [Pararobbsia silviterrae]